MKIYLRITTSRTLYVECHQGFMRNGKCKQVSDLANLETIDQFFLRSHLSYGIYVLMKVHQNKIFSKQKEKMRITLHGLKHSETVVAQNS